MSNTPRIPAALSLDGLGTDARAAFDLAAEAGYRGIAIPTHHPQLKPAELGTSARRHLRNILDSKQLQVETLRVAAPRGGLGDPATIDRTLENARAAIELAYTLGVRTVALHTGPLEGTNVPAATVEEAVKLLAGEADKAGVTLALTADSSQPLRRLIEAVAAPFAQANFDPARALGAGEDPLAGAKQLAGHIAALAGADALRMGQQVRAVALGEGQVPWQELLELLREQDFKGPVVVDVRDLPNGVEGAHQAARLLRRVL